MAHIIAFMTYKAAGSYSWRNPSTEHLSPAAWVSGSALWHLRIPQSLSSADSQQCADIRARKPHRQEFAYAQNLASFQRIYGFWLFLAFSAAIQGKTAVSFGSVEGEEEGKNIQGHQLVFILCSNSNQLPVCREVLG